jgi:hypothetical protein
MTYCKDRCESDACRDPLNQEAYVTTARETLCVPCYLVGRGVDEADAIDIVTDAYVKN